jgi:hypothetical protein
MTEELFITDAELIRRMGVPEKAVDNAVIFMSAAPLKLHALVSQRVCNSQRGTVWGCRATFAGGRQNGDCVRP